MFRDLPLTSCSTLSGQASRALSQDKNCICSIIFFAPNWTRAAAGVVSLVVRRRRALCH